MIKINKAGGYLLGLLSTLIIYFIGQLLFFVNTEKVNGEICEIRQSVRGKGRYAFFYVCFTTKENIQVKANAGSNFKYDFGEIVPLIYKTGNPSKIRINEFSALWLMHCWPYIIIFAVIMAFVTGIWYETKYVVIYRNPYNIRLQDS
ncbi:MAG: hypothetical protein ABI675_05715 [Chitinophagaceae bacterium]